ncbi:hypothetical protein GGR51DRAFT_192594 [Nemania sp. FL0031]|nr:hypothetical protein GGR51DRAFT_192594 [Nemania sp. FL0031]
MGLKAVLLSSLMAAWPCYASPMPMPMVGFSLENSPETELLVREGINLARSLDVEKRASADFSLEKSWNNEVLFSGATNPGAVQAQLSVTCLECYTHGTVTAKVTDEHFLNPVLRLSFSGVEAYASLGVAASAEQTFSINLFASNSPIGIGITGLDVGVVFFVDLVFSLSEAIDLTGGFSVSVPDDAYLEASIFKGDIDDSSFGGLNGQYLPVTVTAGHATFKADLRLRVQAGAEASIDLFGIGAGAVVGIYANLIEFGATIEETATCDLEAAIWWDLNVGAYAHLDVVVDYTTLGPVPTVSTTLMAAATISTCLIDGGATTTALPATTTSEIAATTSAYSSPAVSSSPAETGVTSIISATGIKGVTEVTSSALATGVSAADTVPVWSPTFILSVTESEVSFTVADPLPTDTATSELPAGTSSTLATIVTSAGTSVATSADSSALTSALTSAGTSIVTSVSTAAVGTSAGTSGYSSGAASSMSANSSAYPTSLIGAGTLPVPSSSAFSSAAAGPTYTSTYTHTMTICGAPGVMNCPTSYQTEVVVTRTTTICPGETTATSAIPTVIATTGISPAPISVESSSPSHSGSNGNGGSSEVVVIVLTPLPTPVVATFTAPTSIAVAATATGVVVNNAYPEGGLSFSSTTTATETSTTTVTVKTSHSSSVVVVDFTPTPVVAAIPSGGAATFGNGTTTVAGTGYVPGATQSAGSSTPVIAGADSLLGSVNGAYVGAIMTFVVALCMGLL